MCLGILQIIHTIQRNPCALNINVQKIIQCSISLFYSIFNRHSFCIHLVDTLEILKLHDSTFIDVLRQGRIACGSSRECSIVHHKSTPSKVSLGVTSYPNSSYRCVCKVSLGVYLISQFLIQMCVHASICSHQHIKQCFNRCS